MENLSFQDFRRMSKLNLDKKYVEECLNIIENGECIFHPGTVQPKSLMVDIYNFRLKIAQESHIKSEVELDDFKNTVANLKNTPSSEIGIVTFNIDYFVFIVFYNPDNHGILGILKFKSANSLKEVEEMKHDYINRGLSSDASKYLKGELIYTWDKK